MQLRRDGVDEVEARQRGEHIPGREICAAESFLGGYLKAVSKDETNVEEVKQTEGKPALARFQDEIGFSRFTEGGQE